LKNLFSIELPSFVNVAPRAQVTILLAEALLNDRPSGGLKTLTKIS
jgi:hypothetical protein